eukprot:gene19191-931_t
MTRKMEDGSKAVSVFVGGLDEGCKHDDLKDHFECCGEVHGTTTEIGQLKM